MRARYEELLSGPLPEHLTQLLRRAAVEMLRLPSIEDGPQV
jgi:hypothetical protein